MNPLVKNTAVLQYVLAALAGMALVMSVMPLSQVSAIGDDPFLGEPTYFCKALGNGDYISKKIKPVVQQWDNTGDVSGLEQETVASVNHDNIIPPFTGEDEDYEGYNWDSDTQEIWANDCVVPTFGSITIEKEVVDAEGDDADKTFSFAGNDHPTDGNDWNAPGFDLQDGESKTFSDLPADMTYFFSEDLHSDKWDVSVSCDSGNVSIPGPDADVAVHLEAEDDITCTFTNTYIGKDDELDNGDGHGDIPTQDIPEQCISDANLLTNGSFEQPVITENTGYQFVSSPYGWTTTKVSDESSADLEFHREWSDNDAAHGNQYVELDAHESVRVAQNVNLEEGATYELFWAFAPRHEIDAEQNQLAVELDGSIVATEGPLTGTSPLAVSDWVRNSYSFTATGTSAAIAFADAGSADSFGTFLDDAVLCKTEEPQEEEVDNAQISPILECVIDQGEGVYEAHFSYETHNNVDITIEEGADNKLTGDYTGGPVTEFTYPAPNNPGGNREGRTGFYPDNSFSVPFSSEELVWTLTGPDGSTRTATASADSEACAVDEEAEIFTFSGHKYDVTGDTQVPVADWEFELYSRNDGERFIASTTTNGDGEYEFEVNSDQHDVQYLEVREVMQDGWSQDSIVVEGVVQESCSLMRKVRFSEYDGMESYEVVVQPTELNCDFLNNRDDDDDESEDRGRPETIQSGNAGNAPSAGRVAGAATSTEPDGEVLGEAVSQCQPLLSSYMRADLENDVAEVYRLQAFLIARGYGDVEMTGEFDVVTDQAVRDFQAAHQEDVLQPWYDNGLMPHNNPTGYVYMTTRWKINNIYCPDSEELPELR